MKGKNNYLSLFINHAGICKYYKSNSEIFSDIIDISNIEGNVLHTIFKLSKFSDLIQETTNTFQIEYQEQIIEHNNIHYLISFQPVESEDLNLIITIRTSDVSKNIDLLKHHYDCALNQSNVGLWVWLDIENDISWWSDSFYDMLGYETNEISPSMKNFIELVHPEHIDGLSNRLELIYNSVSQNTHKKIQEEFKVRTKKGDYIDLLFTSTPLKNDKDELIGFSGTVVEIGQLKMVEEKLLESENKLILALEASNMGIWSWDIIKDEIYWSEQVKTIFGVDADGFDGTFESYLNLIPVQERKFVTSCIQDVLQTNKTDFSFEHSVCVPSGKLKLVYCKGKLFRNAGVPDKMTGVVIDISQENDLKVLLGQTKGQYKSVIESMIEGVIILDMNGKIIDYNNAALVIIGYEEYDLIGKDFSFGPGKAIKEDFSLFPHNEFPGIVTLKTGKACKNVTLGWVKPNKEIIWLSINSEPVVNEVGELIAVACSYSDVTERFQSIQALQIKNRQLEDFAHITSHNLRSPISNLSILLDYFDASKNEEERREYFKNLKHVSNNLLSTIQVLAEALKIHRDFVDDETELDFQEMVDNVLSLLSGQIKEADISFQIDFSACNKIFYSHTYLQSIFINLISNAIKYRASGRATLIKIDTYKSENGKVVLKISDNGIGIDIQKNQHKIFGLYKTFHANKDSRGVGLYMTKRQIETLGGAIFVESKINVGTTFTIIF